MAKRLSVTLAEQDMGAIATFGDEETPEGKAIAEWAASHGIDTGGSVSEASLVRILLRAGAEALREQALDIGYAELAEMTSESDRAEVGVARARHARRSDAAAIG